MIQTIKIGTLKWHHILDPSDEDLQFLTDNFHFHPLDIEDCRSVNQRPKIDIYDDYYFLILHFPNYDRWNRFLKTKEVKIFWGDDYIITIGKSHWVVGTLFNSASEKEADPYEILQAGTSDALLYIILERLMQETQSLISKLGIEVELINRDLFNKKAEKTIERISLTRRNIILLNTIFKPQLRLFHKFESGEIEGYAENMEEYWGNILDYYQKMWDMIEDYQELVEGLSKTFDSMQTNKSNEIMKVLTLVSSILLPLTFIASLYGMNVGLPYQNHPFSFWLLMISMVLIAGAMIFYFKRKNWM
jgi:magnesium transporter